MNRLLQYPPNQPLVHVDHSHRRVLAAPPKRQVVTREKCSHEGDLVVCSVPVYSVYGSYIDRMTFPPGIDKNSDMNPQMDWLKMLLEERSASFALVYYGGSKWESVLERRGLSARDRYTLHPEALRNYLIKERNSADFKIRLSNNESKPSVPTLR
jgi:hypothetical protein